MQTFMPYAPERFDEAMHFTRNAQVLDRQRLGKQRVEGMQILRCLLGASDGWVNHPATKMWRGYETYLAAYTITVCKEWKNRGYEDTVEDKITSMIQEFALPAPHQSEPPGWFGLDMFHRSHQSNLVRKDPGYYRIHFPDVPNDLPYFWPVDYPNATKLI